MKIIVPMAGRGSRLRPHTLITPKPLIPVAGKPIVQRLLEDIIALCNESVEEIAFIIGDFELEIENQLHEIAKKLGSPATIYHQEKPLGTAHAIWQAQESIDGEVIIAFADTLFSFPNGFELDTEKDGLIWVKKVEDPRQYGVVTLNEEGVIQQLVEKPQEFVSDLGILGIYYIKDGNKMKQEVKYILDQNIKDKGEYQFTSVLDIMRKKGANLYPAEVIEWMDCGNKYALLDTTKKILTSEAQKGNLLVSDEIELANAIIIPPCYIGKGVKLRNSIVGPYVSIGEHTQICNSVIRESSIRAHSMIENTVLQAAMIGMHAFCQAQASAIDMGDYSRI